MPVPVSPGRGASPLAAILAAVAARVGRRITAGAIVAAMRRFGIAAVQQFTGLTAPQLMFVWNAKVGSKRYRRRGVTGRQLSNAVRVTRTLTKMYHQLHRGGGHRAAPSPFRRRRRK